jgi:hypothetical protein
VVESSALLILEEYPWTQLAECALSCSKAHKHRPGGPCEVRLLVDCHGLKRPHFLPRTYVLDLPFLRSTDRK